MPTGEIVEWTNVPDPRFQEEVAGWGWSRDPETTLKAWVQSGTCPTCGHPTARRVSGGISHLRARAKPYERLPILVFCDCQFEHPGRPTDAIGKGCGQVAWVPRPS